MFGALDPHYSSTVRCTFGEVPEVWDGVLVRMEVELAEVLAHVAVVPTEEVPLPDTHGAGKCARSPPRGPGKGQ